MDIVELGPWIIQIESNQEEIATNSSCPCLYCLNFYYTVDQMDAKETKVLKKLGIHPLNPIQLSYFGETESQEHLYSGSFHVKGTLLVGKPVRISEWTPLNIFSIGKIKFVISDEVNLVPDDCAFPLLQLDFEWELPWSFEGKPE